MEARELRIGNLVTNENEKVIEICATRIVFLYDKKVKYKPIPLTEEWLLKFGIRSETDKKRFFINGCEIYIFSENKIWFNPSSSTMSFELKSLHQLQNLMFALTGEELKIKEEAENLTE